MSDFLDNDAQINAFILAMTTRRSQLGTTYRRVSVSRDSESPSAPQNVQSTPPLEPEVDAQDEEHSGGPSFDTDDGGIELSNNGQTWNDQAANTPTAVDEEDARELALDQVRSSMTEIHIQNLNQGQTFSTAITPEVGTPYQNDLNTSPVETLFPSIDGPYTAMSSPEIASPVVTGVRPPPPTPQSAAQNRIDDIEDIHSGDIVQDILGTIATHSPYGLNQSIHAPAHLRNSPVPSRNSSAANIRYTNARDAMRGNNFDVLATLPENDSNIDPSRVEDTGSFVAAMNARINATNRTATVSSAQTTNINTTATGVSNVTAKNTGGKPFDKEEARGLLLSPKKKTFNSNKGLCLP
jgi:hypothetical protein